MISLLCAYLDKVARGRWRLVISWELGLSLAVTLLFFLIPWLQTSDRPIEVRFVASKLAETLGSYSATGFGATFAALMLAARWANLSLSLDYLLEGGDYFDIFFRLSWTTIVDLCAMLIGKFATLLMPVDLVFPDEKNSFATHFSCCCLLFLFCYCILLSFSVLLSTASLCVLYSETQEETELLKETTK